MSAFPSEGFIRVYKPDLSKFDTIPLKISTTAQEINSQIGGTLYVRTANGTERKLRAEETPLTIFSEWLLRIGYTAAEIPLQGKEDHSYCIRFQSGLSAFAIPEETVSIKGVLSKEGHGLMKKWADRFCVIKGNKFYYYENPSATEPLGSLLLTGTQVAEEDKKSKPFCFSIRGDGKMYYFACDSNVDRKNWLARIQPIAMKDPNALNLAQHSLESIPSDILAKKASTTTALDLTKNFINVSQDFSAFKNLTKLQLIENNLDEIPSGIFALTNLAEFDIGRNQIRAIPPAIQKLTNLRVLAVHNNSLSTLPNELRSLSKLTTLMIAFNDFTQIPSVVCEMTSLLQLIATANAIESLPDNIGNLTNLSLLDVRYNFLKALPASVKQLVNLTRIDIRQNPLSTIPPVLVSLPKLETLDIGPNMFGQTSLDLALPALKTIRSPDSFLPSLSFASGVTPTHLTKINLSDNNLTTLPDAIGDLPHLESLIVKNNKLTSLPEKIFSIPTLKWLYVGYNQITALPEKIGKKCLIQLFEVQHNKLTKLPANLFRYCYMLRICNFSNNQLTELPALAEAEELNAIEELYIGQNNLSAAAIDHATNFLKLKSFDVSYNKIGTLSQNISRLSELVTLNVAGNELAELPKSIKQLKKLKYFLCNNNNLRDVPALPESILHIDIGSNKFFSFPASVRALPALEILDISGNFRLAVNGSVSSSPALKKIVAEAIVSAKNLTPDQQSKIEFGGFVLGDAWSYGSADLLGRRLRMEDAIIKMRKIRGNDLEAVFGIFDGHSGPAVADILAKNFPATLESELGRLGTSDPLGLLRYVFLNTNRSIGEQGHRIGSTGGVIYLQRLDSGVVRLFTANVGDTEAVLCRGGNKYEVLTEKHSVDLASERTRILALNGFISDDDRVNGILATTRVFGDQYLNPFVTPNPHLKAVNIMPEDEFVILACDGLWDVVSYELAISIVRSVPDPVSAAKKLRDLAYLYGSEDNISVLVVMFKKYIPQQTAEDTAEAAEAEQRAANEAKMQSESSGATSSYLGEYKFIKWVGEGSFGKVALAQKNGAKNYVAVKIIQKNADNAASIAIERSMEKLKHPFICNTYSSMETATRAYLIMEYVGGGNFAVPENPNDKFPEKVARFYACQIASALRYLHKSGFIYRDIALHNLLLDVEGNVKLIDFGLAASQSSTSAEFAGTPGFMAPEMVTGKSTGADRSVDWWGLGIILYMMLVGRPPFFADNLLTMKNLIVNEEPYFPHALSKASKSALVQLLAKNPAERLGNTPDESDVLKHPFFKEIDFAKLEAGQIKPPTVPKVAPIKEESGFAGWHTV